MNKKLLLCCFLILGGCATKQIIPPVDAPRGVIPGQKAPVPAVAVPAPPSVVTPVPAKIEPPSAPQVEPQLAESEGELSQEYVLEHGQAVDVVTDPAGAKIELNGKPLGVSPGTFHMIRKPNQYGFLPRMTIKAIPPQGSEGLHVQTKVFDGYTPTPEKLYFDMSSPPPLPSLEDGY